MNTLIDFLGFLWFLFRFLFIISFFVQYFVVIGHFIDGKWNTKKEFLLHLIPGYPHVYLTRDLIREAVKHIKETWKKLK